MRSPTVVSNNMPYCHRSSETQSICSIGGCGVASSKKPHSIPETRTRSCVVYQQRKCTNQYVLLNAFDPCQLGSVRDPSVHLSWLRRRRLLAKAVDCSYSNRCLRLLFALCSASSRGLLLAACRTLQRTNSTISVRRLPPSAISEIWSRSAPQRRLGT